MLRCLTIASLLVATTESDCKAKDPEHTDACLDLAYDQCIKKEINKKKACDWGGRVPERRGLLYMSTNGKTLYDSIPDPPLNVIFVRTLKTLPWSINPKGRGEEWGKHYKEASFTWLDGNYFDVVWYHGDSDNGIKPGQSEGAVVVFDNDGVVTHIYSASFGKETNKVWNEDEAKQKGVDMDLFKKYIEADGAKQAKQEAHKKHKKQWKGDYEWTEALLKKKYSKNKDIKKLDLTATGGDIKMYKPPQLKQVHGTCALFSMKHLVHDFKKDKFNAKSMELILQTLLDEEKSDTNWKHGINAKKGVSSKHCHCSWKEAKGLEAFDHELINYAMSYVGVTEEEIPFSADEEFVKQIKSYKTEPGFLGLRFIYYEMKGIATNWIKLRYQRKEKSDELWKGKLHSVAFVWYNKHWWYQNSNEDEAEYIVDETQLVLKILSKKWRPKGTLYKVHLIGNTFTDKEITAPKQKNEASKKAINEYYNVYDGYDEYGEYDKGHSHFLYGSSNHNENAQNWLLIMVNFIILIIFCCLCLVIGVGSGAVLFIVYKFVLPKNNIH